MSDIFSGNKGEWSEPYVILKLLADGTLHQADEKMEPSPVNFAKVVGAFREDTSAVITNDEMVAFTYSAKEDGTTKNIEIERQSLSVLSEKLYQAVIETAPGNGSFRLDEIADRLRELGFSQLKNPVPRGLKSVKRDLSLKILDPNTGTTPKLGFSVKSELGASPTLLNASKATNIIYRLDGFSDEKMQSVNAIKTTTKLIDRAEKIKSEAKKIEFVRYQNEMFYNNLLLIDCGLPRIVADALYLHYFASCVTTSEMLDAIRSLPPYNGFQEDFCAIKYKRFLRACALGMMPSKEWNDVDEASGGYIVVRSTGAIIAFYIYNRALFDQYLVENTQFERGSTSRHEYMSVFKEKNEYFLALNLQIRFKH